MSSTSFPGVERSEGSPSNPDLASHQKLSQILGNDFYLSSEVMANGTLRVRICLISPTK